MTSLRVAEEILADARRAGCRCRRWPAPTCPRSTPSSPASDAALDFARREFNAAVAAYNAAVRQFPTVLVARLFGFRAGATL